MARDSWTRRLDDRVLGRGLPIVFAVVGFFFGVRAVFLLGSGSWLWGVVYGLLAVLSAQAVRTEWRRRSRS